MKYGVPNFASIELWRVRPGRASDGNAWRLASLFQRAVDHWLPLFRYHGGILNWAIDGGGDRAATFAIFASEEGMQEFHSGFYGNPEVKSLFRDEAELMTRVTGPMTDTFSHGLNTNSALRELEAHADADQPDGPHAGYLAIYRWQITEDSGPLPNGADLSAIPEGQRYGPYLETILPGIVRRLEQYQMLGGWTVDTGGDTLTSIGVYPAAQTMQLNLENVLAPGTQRSRTFPHLELIDQIVGSALDLMLVGAGEVGAEEAVTPDS